MDSMGQKIEGLDKFVKQFKGMSKPNPAKKDTTKKLTNVRDSLQDVSEIREK